MIAARRHGAPHPAQHVRRRRHRRPAHPAPSSIPSAAATTRNTSPKRASSCSAIRTMSSRSRPRFESIAIIGGHADIGVLSGGGSAQVDAPGGNALDHTARHRRLGASRLLPLRAAARDRRARAGRARRLQRRHRSRRGSRLRQRQPTSPSSSSPSSCAKKVDAPNLSLPDDQDALVAAVAAANPHTIVVIESGGPVTMPWVRSTSPASSKPGIPASAARRRSPTSSSAPSTPPANSPLPSRALKPTCRILCSPAARASSRRDKPAAQNETRPLTWTTYRRRARRLQVVRLGEQAAALSLRLRPQLHHLRLLRPQSRCQRISPSRSPSKTPASVKARRSPSSTRSFQAKTTNVLPDGLASRSLPASHRPLRSSWIRALFRSTAAHRIRRVSIASYAGSSSHDLLAANHSAALLATRSPRADPGTVCALHALSGRLRSTRHQRPHMPPRRRSAPAQ